MVIINFGSKRINAKYDMMFFSGLDRKLLKKLQFPFTAQIESGAVNYTAGFIVRRVAKKLFIYIFAKRLRWTQQRFYSE
jgi:hypothetical protein